jgi:hypothetical protein
MCNARKAGLLIKGFLSIHFSIMPVRSNYYAMSPQDLKHLEIKRVFTVICEKA